MPEGVATGTGGRAGSSGRNPDEDRREHEDSTGQF